MPQITPNLWFDTEGLEAAEFYCSVFPNSEIKFVSHYTDAGPGPEGSVLTVDFVLDGQSFTAINGGPQFPFTEAVSLLINCADQAEVDYYWDKLTAGGRGEPVRVAQGPVRPVVAGGAGRVRGDHERPRPGEGEARHGGDVHDEEARRRGVAGGRRRRVMPAACQRGGRCMNQVWSVCTSDSLTTSKPSRR